MRLQISTSVLILLGKIPWIDYPKSVHVEKTAYIVNSCLNLLITFLLTILVVNMLSLKQMIGDELVVFPSAQLTICVLSDIRLRIIRVFHVNTWEMLY